MGLCPLYPPVFARPRLLMVCQRFESHSVVGLQGLAAHPFLPPLQGGYGGWGHIPQTPCHGVFAPLYPPVFAHPRLLRVCQGFESHSVAGW